MMKQKQIQSPLITGREEDGLDILKLGASSKDNLTIEQNLMNDNLVDAF